MKDLRFDLEGVSKQFLTAHQHIIGHFNAKTWKDLGFEEKWRLEIWLNDLNPFLERFEM